jgi:broad specificity phosphatase PhoE
MATTVYLTRHGQTEWNSRGRMMGWADEDINELGRAQATRLALRMEKLRLDAVYTSPLSRAITTGAIIGKNHGLTPHPVQGLIEINYGDWEGLYRKEVNERWPELQKRMHDDPSGLAIPGGETFKQLEIRVVGAFNDVVRAEEGKHVLMVSHQGILKVLVSQLLDISYRDWNKFEIQNTSFTKLTVDKGHIHLITLNDISHLEDIVAE